MNTIKTLVAQATQNTIARYNEGDTKVLAAKAGRSVIDQHMIEVRRAATGRFGMNLLLREAGIIDCNVGDTLVKLTDYLLQQREIHLIAEDAFNGFLASSWGWKPFHSSMLSAFSVKTEDGWVSANDKEHVMEAIATIGKEEWLQRGFWDALRWLVANDAGVEAINTSEFFQVRSFSDIYKIRGQLTWWSSFKEEAQKGATFQEERLANSEKEYHLSGGCNTHYVGEQQEKTEAAVKRLEKATEAAELMQLPEVVQFIDRLCKVFELAGKEQPLAGEYSPEVQHEKQLANMATAADQALANANAMVEAAIAKGRIAA